MFPFPETAIFIDFDNCLEPTHPAIEEALETFYMQDFGFSRDEARLWRINTFAEYGCTLTGMARHFNRTESWVRQSYLQVGERSSFLHLQKVPPCPRMPALLAKLESLGVVTAIISQNHHAAILPIMAERGYLRFIPESRVFDRTRTNGGNKTTEDPYRIAMAAMPGHIKYHWMLDDTPANLPAARRRNIATVLTGDRVPHPTEARSITHTFPSAADFLEAFLAQTLSHAA